MRGQRLLRPVAVCGVLLVCPISSAAPPEPVPDKELNQSADNRNQRPPLMPLPDALSGLLDNAIPLNPQRTVFLNRDEKRIYLHTEVSCRNCVLEMLCVPIGQREHETILNVRARAFVIHAGLVALGLKPGKPAAFYPDYRPPEGPALDMRVHWVDRTEKLQSEDPRSWIRHSIHRYFSRSLAAAPPGIELPHEELRYDPYNRQILWYGPMTKKQRQHLLTLWEDINYQDAIRQFYEESQSRPMEAGFVFTGSRWHTNEATGRRRYTAEDGHFITVANFPSSTIDIAEASSSSDGGQLYEAWEQRIPAEGTPVILEIGPTIHSTKPGTSDSFPKPSVSLEPNE
ncbi:MAG: YdjY domain-containing protein [Fuerstiella sp.]|nr:YdjY domain-containing protein [Fuerstiella sp.]